MVVTIRFFLFVMVVVMVAMMVRILILMLTMAFVATVVARMIVVPFHILLMLPIIVENAPERHREDHVVQ